MSEAKDFAKRNFEQIENVLAERDRLRAVNAKLLEACRMLSSVVPEWAEKDVPGLNPVFYGTGSYDGDVCVIERVKAARAAIAAAEEEEVGVR